MNQSVNSTILVTGASGFLGSAVVAQLRALGRSVRTTGRRAMPDGALPNYRPLDLSDETAIRQLAADADVIIHTAGLAHQHHAAPSQSDAFFRVNARGTAAVARAAAAAGCRRFVLVSSVSVYGNGSPSMSERDPCFPLGPYACSKLEAERLATEIATSASMELVILRMATLYGENDPGNVGRLLRAIDRRRFFWIGPGQNCKSLVHVDDAARACVAAATFGQLPQATTFNIAANPCSMQAIVATIADTLGRGVLPFRLPARLPLAAAAFAARVPGIARRGRQFRATLEKWLSDEVFDATSFRDAFGWRPEVTLDIGLALQVARYRR